MIKYLKKNAMLFFKGIAIGTANIIPGVSGGTIAFLLGIYDDMIEAIAGIRRHFMKSILFLLPILIGALGAVLALVFPITWAFDHYPLPLVTLFAGLIIGGLPSLLPTIKGQFSWWRFVILLITAAIAVALGALSVVTSFDASSVLATITPLNATLIIVVGILGSAAMVMPGISGSMQLLVIGFYAPLTELLGEIMGALVGGTLFTNWTPILVVIFFALGLIGGFFLISLLMKFLLQKYKLATYFGIIGFILGSLFALYYNYEVVWMYSSLPWWHMPIAVALLALGIVSSLALAKYGKEHNQRKQEPDA